MAAQSSRTRHGLDDVDDARVPPYWRSAATAAVALAATVVSVAGAARTADFRDEYAIEYDPRLARFLVDGVELQRRSSGLTNSAMYLFVNAWFTSWLAGERPTTDRFTLVDRVEYEAR